MILIDALKKVEQAISREKGPLNLFALFLREGAPDRWDLVVSASWTTEAKDEALKYVAAKLAHYVKRTLIISVSRIVLLDPMDPGVQSINRALCCDGGITEVKDSNFFGLEIKHGFILRSQLAQVKVAKGRPIRSDLQSVL